MKINKNFLKNNFFKIYFIHMIIVCCIAYLFMEIKFFNNIFVNNTYPFFCFLSLFTPISFIIFTDFPTYTNEHLFIYLFIYL